jgi:hypothetical protein
MLLLDNSGLASIVLYLSFIEVNLWPSFGELWDFFYFEFDFKEFEGDDKSND